MKDTDPAGPPIRAGIVGAGFMGVVHARAIRTAGARIAAVATSRAESAEGFAASVGAAKWTADPDELIASDALDVVHVCTPNDSHAPLALAGLHRGRHVICEKPLATTVDASESLAAEAAAAGVVATVPFVYRFYPMIREARARVLGGGIGDLVSVHGSYHQDWLARPDDDDWRVDAERGGRSRAFADIGSHLADLVEFVTGDRVARLTARTRTVHATRSGRAVTTEDLAVATVELAGGAPGQLSVSQVAHGHRNDLALEVVGTLGSVRFTHTAPDELWVARPGSTEVVSRDAAVMAPDAARFAILPPGHPMGYQDAFDAFVADSYAAIRGDRRDGLPTFAAGARAAAITAAVLDAAAGGGWVEVRGEAP
jgi:predicted dehydrogenase